MNTDFWEDLRKVIKALEYEQDLLIKDFVIAKATDSQLSNALGGRLNKISSILRGLSDADTEDKMKTAFQDALALFKGPN